MLRFAVVAAFGAGALVAVYAVTRAHGGSLGGLTFISYWQLAVGLGALIISGSVWALRPGDLATRLFLISGLATLTFTFAPVPFSVQDLDGNAEILRILNTINGTGATAFGIAMIALFVIYPNRLPGWRWIGTAVLGVFGTWSALILTGHAPGTLGLHFVTLIEMFGIFVALIAQYFAARGDPKARAILIWLGGSVTLGAGAFIGTVALPSAMGMNALIDARLAFGFFLIIYIGCAAGLGRYRLFELGDWAFRAVFYFIAAILLVALDAVLIFFLPLEPGPALGISVLIIALIYLPFRDALSRLVLRRASLADKDVFGAVMDTAFEVSAEARARQWRDILGRLFEPLEIETAAKTDGDQVQIRDDGLELRLPAIADSPALRLRYPWRGQGLFGPRHLRTAEELCTLMRQADASRAAYDRGVAEERSRIARDMHDNIGAQLLGALHSRETDRKDTMIRETLTDLRDIINNASSAGMALVNLVADLRAETAERLAAADIALDWTVDIAPGTDLSPVALHALRSVLRECVSNSIRHARASQVGVRLEGDGTILTLTVSDDGTGFDPDTVRRGNGLGNLESRMAGVKGGLELASGGTGTTITARFPAGNGGEMV